MSDQKKPVLEPTTQAFVDALAAQGGKPLYELSYADARKLLEDAQTIAVQKLPADVEEKIRPWVQVEKFQFASIVRRAPKAYCPW